MRKHVVFIIILISLVHLNSLFGSFVYDDYNVVVNNDFVKHPKNLVLLFSRKYLTKPTETLFDSKSYNFGSGETTYRPVATLTYFINYALFKLNPWGYRFTNVLIHIVNTILVYLLLNVLFSNPKLSLFSALLFGSHPINGEVLNCTGFRPNSLVFLFSILAIILYFKFKAKVSKFKCFYLFLSLFSAMLAVFSKEIAVILPFALILCEYYLLEFDFKRLFANLRYYLLYFLVDVFYILVYFNMMPPTQKIFIPFGQQDIYINFVRMFDILTIYLKDIIFPTELAFIPPMVVQASLIRIVVGVLVALISIYIVTKKGKFPKEISFAILWFFLWLLPMNNFLNTFRILLAYRYIYTAMMGFALILGFFLMKLWQRSTKFLSDMLILRRLSVLSCFGFFSLSAIVTNAYWKNEMILYLSVIEKYPSVIFARIAIGQVLLKYGDYKGAIKELNSVLSGYRSMISRYDLANTYYSLALVYKATAEYSKAEQMYLEAIKLFPDKPQLYTQLGICYGQRGLYEKALEQFNKAKKIDPYFVSAYIANGLTYKLMHKYTEAEVQFRRALEIYPDCKEASYNLANLKEVRKEQ